MVAQWTDFSGRVFEIRQEVGEWWYRLKGEGDDEWKKGHPPGWIEKAKIPLDQR
jgi:hypothetical protein